MNLKAWEFLNDVFTKALRHFPGGSQPSETNLKANDLLAFRTITTMLSFIQSPNTFPPIGPIVQAKDKENRHELRVLDALSSVLVRQHEIAAVVSKPCDRQNPEVIASVTYPTDTESLLPLDPKPGDGFWTRFIVAPNSRKDKINGRDDSLINKTSLPTLRDSEVDGELDTAQLENKRLLKVYLETQWGKESYDTHVWMIKTLLAKKDGPDDEKSDFLLYIIAVSFQKMHRRITNSQVSERYFKCLSSIKTFVFNGSQVVKKPGGRDNDMTFASIIPVFARVAKTKIPNLQYAARQSPRLEIYNENTHMEFHLLLLELLSDYKISLTTLKKLHSDTANQKRDVEKILLALQKVFVYGRYLMVMARSDAIEVYLEDIKAHLDVDEEKSWIPMVEEEGDFSDFQALKPFSMRKGKPLLPWESYREWLRLMVHYFDAGKVLTGYVSESKLVTFPIAILSLPVPKGQMPWIKLLQSERYFPDIPGPTQPSGKEFVNFLTSMLNAPDDSDNSDNSSKCTAFYTSLKSGSLHSGIHFKGTYHCEAYIACLLVLLWNPELVDFEDQLRMLAGQEEIKQMKVLLEELKGCRHPIGVSKRCCPVCGFLLNLLNQKFNTKFVVSDVHSNITSCALPGWLPGEIVYLMVMEFGGRLREELRKLQQTNHWQQRLRSGTTDTVRISIDSTRSADSMGRELVFVDEAFASSQRLSESES